MSPRRNAITHRLVTAGCPAGRYEKTHHRCWVAIQPGRDSTDIFHFAPFSRESAPIEVLIAAALELVGWLLISTARHRSMMGLSYLPAGQPAVTSLCVMAFLSRGHQPGLGPYGQRINRAIDFVISCQMPDGLFSFRPPEIEHKSKGASHAAVYNHAIAGLMLGEVYVTSRVRGGRRKTAMKRRPVLPVNCSFDRNRIRSIREAGGNLRLPYGSLAPIRSAGHSWSSCFAFSQERGVHHA